jgi:hypothetical protein
MAVAEVLEGTVASIDRQETRDGDLIEFDLRSSGDRVRRVRTRQGHDDILHEGAVVAVVGQVDPNGILVADRVDLVRGTLAAGPSSRASTVPPPVPRWLPYAVALSALVAMAMFVLGMASELNRGDGFPLAATVLGGLILVTTRSVGRAARGVVATGLLRYGAKCFMLFALVIWWGGAMRDATPQDYQPLALIVSLVALILLGRADSREMAGALRAGSGAGAPGALRSLAFLATPVAIVGFAFYATKSTDRGAIGLLLLVAGVALIGLAFVTRARTVSSRGLVKALAGFAGSAALLVGIGFLASLLESPPGVIAFAGVLILLGREFAERAPGREPEF